MIAEVKQRYQKYITEFETIPEELKNKRIEEVDKTPSENLSYQLGWLTLLLGWEEKEKAGIEVQTKTLAEQITQLNKKVIELCTWIEMLNDKELFEPEQRKWATTKAKWPLYKWIHINSVAPFTNFRTKIRKWKKIVL